MLGRTHRVHALVVTLALATGGCSLALDFDGYRTTDAEAGDGGGGMDAARDGAAPTDAAADGEVTPDAGPPICSTGDDCDDGVFCNGAETCDPTSAMADVNGCVPADGDPCLDGQTCDDDVDRCLSACDVDADADDDGHDELSCDGDDCDDADPLRYPGATEVCDTEARDEDCNLATVGPDVDGDMLPAITCCNRVSGSPATCGTDCDDTNVNVRPGGTETCNGVDDDCNMMVDDGVGSTWYRDADTDGYGAAGMTMLACTMPTGHVSRSGDCDDTDVARNPGATETCNGVDDDCDMTVDDGAGTTWYRDSDDDGYGVMGTTMVACSMPSGYVARPGDCADGNPSRNPGEMETCDGVDNDCNMLVDDGICPWGCGSATTCDDPIASTAGFEHQCVLLASGRVFCVGSNESGELGVAGSAGGSSRSWIMVTGLPTPVRAISAGGFFTCAIAGSTDQVWCWGANDLFQLGDGTNVGRHTPARVTTTASGNPPLANVAQLSAGYAHACAVTSSGAVWCWGSNASLQIGASGSPSRAVTVSALSGASRVSAGFSHSCAIASSTVQCWGSNGFGELGRGTTGGSSATPMGVMGMSGTMVSASAGRWTSCSVRADGYGFCWGRNTYGQIGNGTMTNSATARQVSLVTNDLRTVDCGYESCCALRGTDHIACWGNGVDGAIGDGTTMDRTVPVETAGLHSYSSVETSGSWVSAVVRSGGIVRAWGYNGRGQLGNGTTTSATVPTPVTPP